MSHDGVRTDHAVISQGNSTQNFGPSANGDPIPEHRVEVGSSTVYVTFTQSHLVEESTFRADTHALTDDKSVRMSN